MQGSDPLVSVVIITRDRSDELLETLRQLRALPEQPPVVVVDNGSSDDTVARARAVSGVQVVPLAQNLGGAGRNLGVACTSSRYVAFADDDMAWLPGALSRAVELLDAWPAIGAVTAHVEVGPARRDDPVSLAMGSSPLVRRGLPGPRVLGFLAGATVFRRDAFVATGGFDVRFGVGGEEALVACDLAVHGWSIVYTPTVRTWHRPSLRRDRSERRRREVRNRLWTAWLRYPFRMFTHVLANELDAARRDGAARAGLIDAVRAFPSLASERTVVPDVVARELAELYRRR